MWQQLIPCLLSSTLITVSLLPFSIKASEYIEYKTLSASVNWSKGQVQATGHGVAPEGKRKQVQGLLACRAALVDAQRNLLEATKGVRVTATTMVSNYVAASDEVKSTVEGLVKGASIINSTMLDDVTCKVTIQISIAGDMASNIYSSESQVQPNQVQLWLPNKLEQIVQNTSDLFANIHWQTLSPISLAHATENNQSTEGSYNFQQVVQQLNALTDRLTLVEQTISTQSKQDTSQEKISLPSGLILDVRGSQFLPSMSPKVKRADGKLLYPTAQSKQLIQKSGRLVSLFARSVEFAINHPIVGSEPLVVKALTTEEKNRTDIILASADAEKLKLLAKSDFFNHAGVIIVLD